MMAGDVVRSGPARGRASLRRRRPVIALADRFTRIAKALSLTYVAAVLAACAPAADPLFASLDLATAKQSVLSQQEELKAAVPPAEVSTSVQIKKSRALFECGNGGYYWPGMMDIVLTADADPSALLTDIKSDWSAQAGWTVTDKTSINGNPQLVITDDQGYRHSIEYNPGRNALYVLSSSACFRMEGGPDPGVDY
ncbi:hypothetical protein ACTAQI_08310 [Pseudarthrobacter sp. alpha12b]